MPEIIVTTMNDHRGRLVDEVFGELPAQAVGVPLGGSPMDAIRDTIATMEAVEDRRAADALRSASTARVLALGSVAALTALGVLTLLVLLYVARRSFDQIRASEQRLAITLRSIGDAVIATDPVGRVVMLNPVAERLTGWSSHEAAGKDMKAIFRIINEQTRATVASPSKRYCAKA